MSYTGPIILAVETLGELFRSQREYPSRRKQPEGMKPGGWSEMLRDSATDKFVPVHQHLRFNLIFKSQITKSQL